VFGVESHPTGDEHTNAPPLLPLLLVLPLLLLLPLLLPLLLVLPLLLLLPLLLPLLVLPPLLLLPLLLVLLPLPLVDDDGPPSSPEPTPPPLAPLHPHTRHPTERLDPRTTTSEGAFMRKR
jgi:hypothetical protein